MPTSPSQRSLQWVRLLGFRAQVVEKWNPHARVRNDLFGIIDILAVSRDGKGTIVAIQATSGSNVAKRVDKVLACEALPDLLAAGWIIEVQGWRKLRNRWKVRRMLITAEGARLVGGG